MLEQVDRKHVMMSKAAEKCCAPQFKLRESFQEIFLIILQDPLPSTSFFLYMHVVKIAQNMLLTDAQVKHSVNVNTFVYSNSAPLSGTQPQRTD